MSSDQRHSSVGGVLERPAGVGEVMGLAGAGWRPGEAGAHRDGEHGPWLSGAGKAAPDHRGAADSAEEARRATWRRGHGQRRQMRAALRSVRLGNVDLHKVTEREAVEWILDHNGQGVGGMVVTPNLDFVRRCWQEVGFTSIVADADLVVADGMPLVWASRLLGDPLPERVAGSDLITSLSVEAAKRGRSVFLMGGAPGTAVAAAEVLKERAPGLKVAGTCCPAPGFENDARALAELAGRLSAARPDVVFVALGSPKQELLIDRLRPLLPGAWWLGVGVSFSFLCGGVRRAPGWMRRTGLEWAHRLMQEPRKLFKRYIVWGVPFAVRLLVGSAGRGAAARVFGRRGVLADEATPVRASDELELAVRTMEKGDVPVRSIEVSGVGGDTRGGVTVSTPSLLRGVAQGPVGESGMPARRSLGKLREVVLLGGNVRATPLGAGVRRSVLDLPVDDESTMLTRWLREAGEVARRVGLAEGLPVRVLTDRRSVEPRSAGDVGGRVLVVERDESEFRGSGGVLGDLASRYAADDLILVASASQILLEPLWALVEALAAVGGDVGVVANGDGTPGGVMLFRAGALVAIPASGFVDLKEQGLPAIAKRFDVRVAGRVTPAAVSVRSLGDYVAALRVYHRRLAGKGVGGDLLAEDWASSFSIIESGADVDPAAQLHDSVVLRGATVEAGAVVVRGVVCPGGVVRRERRAVEQLVVEAGASARSSKNQEPRTARCAGSTKNQEPRTKQISNLKARISNGDAGGRDSACR